MFTDTLKIKVNKIFKKLKIITLNVKALKNVLFMSLGNSKRLNKGNFMLKSNSNKIMMCNIIFL